MTSGSLSDVWDVYATVRVERVGNNLSRAVVPEAITSGDVGRRVVCDGARESLGRLESMHGEIATVRLVYGGTWVGGVGGWAIACGTCDAPRGTNGGGCDECEAVEAAAYATVRIERDCYLCGDPDFPMLSCSHCDGWGRAEVDVPCHELTASEIREIQRRGSPEARAAVDAYLALLRAEEKS